MTEHRLKVSAEKSIHFQNFFHNSLNNENFDGYIQARVIPGLQKLRPYSIAVLYTYSIVKNVGVLVDANYLREYFF